MKVNKSGTISVACGNLRQIFVGRKDTTTLQFDVWLASRAIALRIRGSWSNDGAL